MDVGVACSFFIGVIRDTPRIRESLREMAGVINRSISQTCPLAKLSTKCKRGVTAEGLSSPRGFESSLRVATHER
jgi:hypothetical protein